MQGSIVFFLFNDEKFELASPWQCQTLLELDLTFMVFDIIHCWLYKYYEQLCCDKTKNSLKIWCYR